VLEPFSGVQQVHHGNYLSNGQLLDHYRTEHSTQQKSTIQPYLTQETRQFAFKKNNKQQTTNLIPTPSANASGSSGNCLYVQFNVIRIALIESSTNILWPLFLKSTHVSGTRLRFHKLKMSSISPEQIFGLLFSLVVSRQISIFENCCFD